MTIAMDTALADSRDHDPSFGISDGESFIGFIISDQRNYNDSSPCKISEGDIVEGVLDSPWESWTTSNPVVT